MLGLWNKKLIKIIEILQFQHSNFSDFELLLKSRHYWFIEIFNLPITSVRKKRNNSNRIMLKIIFSVNFRILSQFIY